MSDQNLLPLKCQVEDCDNEATIMHGDDMWCSKHAVPYLTERGLVRPIREQVRLSDQPSGTRSPR